MRFFPASFPALFGSLSFPAPLAATCTPARNPQADTHSANPDTLQYEPQASRFPLNCQFIVGDILDRTEEQVRRWCDEAEQYDLIVWCVSGILMQLLPLLLGLLLPH